VASLIESSERCLVTAPPVNADSDEVALVRAARDGDGQAFGLLYNHHARTVHGLLLARVPPGEVDDLVQEVFLQAWRRLRTLRDPAAFGAWLVTMARRRATDYFRRSAETTALPEEIPAQDRPRAEAVAVLAAIRGLPEAYRETLMLRLVEGMTGPEIARRTGLAPGSVRVNLHRGMKQLREKLGGRITHE
jgi:RNA polymerase sigma-70 factor, ECF subfamily